MSVEPGGVEMNAQTALVLFHAWPVVGHVVYIVRHRRAEGDQS